MHFARHRFCLLLTGLSLLVAVPWQQARADLVTDWNTEALSYMRSSTEAPYVARDLAIMNVAIYNAAESLRGVYDTFSSGSYSVTGAAPAGASYEAAMATAANTVMQSLYGGNSAAFTALYNTQMASVADGQAKDDGVAWGQAIANSILSWRSGDGADAAAGTAYSPVGTIGYWQQTSATATAQLPGWGAVTPFSVSAVSGYANLTSGSLASYLTTSQYAQDFNQVKDLGGLNSVTRTGDQTLQAYFWAAGDSTVKITGMWNQIAATAAGKAGLDVFETARLFAAVNVAMADAGIVAYAQAYETQFWRPETAIANGGDLSFDTDGNAATMGDDTWAPLISSPSLPEYISSQAAFSAAAAAVLAAYLGDNLSFLATSDITKDGEADLTRSYTSFSQAADEAAQSGIYAGTQFGTSVTDGSAAGTTVANSILANNFAPVPEPSGALMVLLGSVLAVLGRRRSRASV